MVNACEVQCADVNANAVADTAVTHKISYRGHAFVIAARHNGGCECEYNIKMPTVHCRHNFEYDCRSKCHYKYNNDTNDNNYS